MRAGAIGVLLLGGLNMLGVVGLRNGALGMPFSGAEKRKKTIINYHNHSCIVLRFCNVLLKGQNLDFVKYYYNLK